MRLVVIAGAAKAGTTAVAEALGRSSQLRLGELKEPRHFYGRDDMVAGPLSERFERTRLRSRDRFVENFAGSTDEVWVDASTDYLNDTDAPRRINEFDDQARIIIGLRHPVTRAFSEHGHLVRNGAENESFLTALHHENERRSNGWVPLFGHVERSLYSPGVQAFLAAVSEQRMFVYQYEDLVANPTVVAAQMSEFLELDEPLTFRSGVNRSGQPRSQRLNALARSDASHIRTVRAGLRKALPAGVGRRIRGAIDSINLARPDAPSPEAIGWILERTADDSHVLEETLQLDLTSYRQPPLAATPSAKKVK